MTRRPSNFQRRECCRMSSIWPRRRSCESHTLMFSPGEGFDRRSGHLPTADNSNFIELPRNNGSVRRSATACLKYSGRCCQSGDVRSRAVGSPRMNQPRAAGTFRTRCLVTSIAPMANPSPMPVMRLTCDHDYRQSSMRVRKTTVPGVHAACRG